MTGVDDSDFGQDRAAAVALAKLRDGKWRQARDEAKKLCKKDKARYLPLLLEANAGLVREMIAKGRTKDAETVVAYLETIAPPELVAALKAEMSAGASAQAMVKGRASAGAEWLVALACAGCLRDGKEISKEDWAAIDRLVAGSFSPTGNDEEAWLAAELELVRKACDATGEGNWEEAREALREVPGSSPFKHWRMFLRGVRCFFEEDMETVQRCFESLPEGGGLELAAKSFGPGVPSGQGPSASPKAEVPFLLAATGQPASWAQPLVPAVEAWRKGRWIRAFEGLLKGPKKTFPTQQPGLASVLTDAILPWGPRMGEKEYDLGEDLSEFMEREGNVRKFGKGGALSCFRPMFLVAPQEESSEEIEATMQATVELWMEAEGSNAIRDGAIWHWAGKRILELARRPRSWLDSRPKAGDIKISRLVLERSIKIDPECEDAWLTLLEAVSVQKDTKSHNRILGEASKKFPQNKGVLKLAGEEALQRRTYSKSLKLLEAARELDPLDKEVKSLLMAGLLGQTLEYLKKAREVAGQWKLMESLLEVRSASGDLLLTPWIWQVRRGLLDPIPETAARALAEAERLAPSRGEFLLMCFVLRNAYQLRSDKNWVKEWRKTLKEQPLGWKAIGGFFPLIDHLSTFKKWGAPKILQIRKVMIDSLDQSMDAAMADDPDGLMEFVEHGIKITSLEGDENVSGLYQYIQDRIRQNLKTAVDKGKGRAGKKVKLDLRIRYAYLRLIEKTEDFLNDPIDYLRDHLNSLESDAAAAGLDELEQRVRAIRGRLSEKYQGFSETELASDEGDVELNEETMELARALSEYLEGLTSGDPVAKARALAVFANEGVTENEVREELGLGPVDEGRRPPPAKPKKKAKKASKKAQKTPKPPVDDHPDFFDLLD